MKNRITALIKPLALSLFALTVFTLGQSVARADEVFLSGYSNGCFACATPPNTSATQTSTSGGLAYTNSTFAGTTSGGFFGLGGFPGNITPPQGTQSTNNLGFFTLSAAPQAYNTTFTLRVTFTAPEGIGFPPGASPLFTAVVTGSVRSDTDGGVFVNFDNTPITFTFTDPNCQATTVPGQQTTCGTGSFVFQINDLSLNPGQTGALSANITSAQQSTIPEPTTMILLGTGLAGVAARARRRRKAVKE